MTPSPHRRGVAAILAAAVLWSTGGVLIKSSALDALHISGYRSLFAAVALIALFRRRSFEATRPTLIASLLYAAILILFVFATKLTTAANAIFLQYSAPFLVLVLEPLILKTKLRAANVVALAVAGVGMGLFFTGQLNPAGTLGNVLALLSGASFALFMIALRSSGVRHPAAAIVQGNLLITLVCFVSIAPSWSIPIGEIPIVAFLGVIQIGLAYAIFTYGIARIEAVEAGLVGMLEPVLNPVWVFLFVGERPSQGAIAGAIVIVAAVAGRTLWESRAARA